MISCDTNILFYSLNQAAPERVRALAFFMSQSNNPNFALCELMLTELYILLRKPAISKPPLPAESAADVIQQFRRHPVWKIVDYPGAEAGLMEKLWQHASAAQFPYRAIFDARLALTLRHHGVTEFATRNVADFKNYGFKKVWNPLA